MGKACEACCVSKDEQRKEVQIDSTQRRTVNMPIQETRTPFSAALCCSGNDSRNEQQFGTDKSFASLRSNQSKHVLSQSSRYYGSNQKRYSSRQIDKRFLKRIQENMHLIVRLQAIARGNRAKKNYAYLRKKQIGSAKYFTLEELMETQGRAQASTTIAETPEAINDLNFISTRELKPAFSFKSGAVYEGQWRGSARDGRGT